jgi:hypothetical protein
VGSPNVGSSPTARTIPEPSISIELFWWPASLLLVKHVRSLLTLTTFDRGQFPIRKDSVVISASSGSVNAALQPGSLRH